MKNQVIVPALLMFLLFILTMSPSHAQTPIETISGNKLQAKVIDAFLGTQMKELQMPGLSIAIINNGEVAYHRALGYKNLTTEVKVDQNTLFEAASMTKPVFAYAVIKLVEKGILELDKPLYLYLPYDDIAHDERYKKITARMVLTHCTGFPNWRNKKFQELEILFEPGSTFSYSGEGFSYLGKVVAHLTGKNLETVVQEEVFSPMGIENSFFVWNDYLGQHKATGYFSGQSPARVYKPLVAHMAGSLHSEAMDFAKFMIGIMNERGLSDAGMHELLKQQITLPPHHRFVEDYGQSEWSLGFARSPGPYGVAHSHGGSNGDFESHFEFFKDRKIGYVFFTNCGKGAAFNRRLNELLRTGKLESLELEKEMEVVNRSIRKRTVKDRAAIELYGSTNGDGIAWLKDKEFTEGVIEVDLLGSDRQGESFIGMAFYGADNSTYDCLYFRPYLFDSTDPAEQKAMVQYLSLPNFGFYKLREERPFEFEAAIKTPPKAEDWFHARIEVANGQLKVFVNHADEATLSVPLLSERRSGKIGFWVGYMSSGRFANLEITANKK